MKVIYRIAGIALLLASPAGAQNRETEEPSRSVPSEIVRAAEVKDARLRLAQAPAARIVAPAAAQSGTARENVRNVDPEDILRRVVGLDLETWSTKQTGPSSRHIGATPEDLAAAFRVPSGDGSVTPSDANGIALAAIQGLNQLINEKEARIAQLERQVVAQQAQLTAQAERLDKIERYLQGRVIAPRP